MKSALLVIDYINGIAKGNGSCAEYLKNHPEIIHNTILLINQAHAIELPVFHIRLAFDSSYSNLPKHAPTADALRNNQLFQLDSLSTQFIPNLSIQPKDQVINKCYGDIFHGNDLITTLKKQGIETLYFTGISTDNAILFSTNTAMLNNFRVVVIQDACAAPTIEAHLNALHIMKNRSVSDIISTQVALNKLSYS